MEQENNGSINRTKKKGLSVSTSNILRNSNSSSIKSTASRSTVAKNKTKLTVPEGPACLERTKKKDHEKAKRQSLSLRRKKCPAASASESFSASAWVGLGHSAPTPAFTISNIRELVTYYHRGSVSLICKRSVHGSTITKKLSSFTPYRSSITAISENIVTNTNKSARSTTDTDDFPPQSRSPILYLSAG